MNFRVVFTLAVTAVTALTSTTALDAQFRFPSEAHERARTR